ncbi:hypothetical protein BDV25DRAFT_166400 [Aspergillus avenaceus]|uniref:Uncharacterized protein n=1 Tax=Aspergillus avenaceus TaxID=36643 RepID=A0A5N6TE15_ASPAV|nr:hypothetical protein BDV25DRAFT_166400 [Aspergillus avenaceus]
MKSPGYKKSWKTQNQYQLAYRRRMVDIRHIKQRYIKIVLIMVILGHTNFHFITDLPLLSDTKE